MALCAGFGVAPFGSPQVAKGGGGDERSPTALDGGRPATSPGGGGGVGGGLQGGGLSEFLMKVTGAVLRAWR